MEFLRHEKAQRGDKALNKISDFPVTICGIGAIGSNLAVNLVRQGFSNLHLVDFDRVEQHNIGTQAYEIQDIGSLKTAALERILWNVVDDETTSYSSKKLTSSNIHKEIVPVGLVVDCFDNSESRRAVYEYCKDKSLPCIHAGFLGLYSGIRWNESYLVPNPQPPGEDICDYPLARNLVLMCVSLLSEAIVQFAVSGKRLGWEITFGDIKIHEL